MAKVTCIDKHKAQLRVRTITVYNCYVGVVMSSKGPIDDTHSNPIGHGYCSSSAGFYTLNKLFSSFYWTQSVSAFSST